MRPEDMLVKFCYASQSCPVLVQSFEDPWGGGVEQRCLLVMIQADLFADLPQITQGLSHAVFRKCLKSGYCFGV